MKRDRGKIEIIKEIYSRSKAEGNRMITQALEIGKEDKTEREANQKDWLTHMKI